MGASATSVAVCPHPASDPETSTASAAPAPWRFIIVQGVVQRVFPNDGSEVLPRGAGFQTRCLGAPRNRERSSVPAGGPVTGDRSAPNDAPGEIVAAQRHVHSTRLERNLCWAWYPRIPGTTGIAPQE